MHLQGGRRPNDSWSTRSLTRCAYDVIFMRVSNSRFIWCTSCKLNLALLTMQYLPIYLASTKTDTHSFLLSDISMKETSHSYPSTTYGSDWHSNGLQHVGIAIRTTDTLQNKTLCSANVPFEPQEKGNHSFKHIHNIATGTGRRGNLLAPWSLPTAIFCHHLPS